MSIKQTSDKKSPNRIILLSGPRSGSYFVLDLLRNLQGVHTELELFNKSETPDSPLTRYVASRLLGSGISPPLPASFTNNYYELSWQFIKEFHTRYLYQSILAFKVIYNQLAPDFIEIMVSTPGTQLVLLERNRLDALVSFIKAKTLNVWSRQDTTNLPVNMDDESLLEICETFSERIKQGKLVSEMLEINKIDYVSLKYEDLAPLSHNVALQVQLVSELCGLEIKPDIQTVFVKQDRGENGMLKTRIRELALKRNISWLCEE